MTIQRYHQEGGWWLRNQTRSKSSQEVNRAGVSGLWEVTEDLPEGRRPSGAPPSIEGSAFPSRRDRALQKSRRLNDRVPAKVSVDATGWSWLRPHSSQQILAILPGTLCDRNQ